MKCLICNLETKENNLDSFNIKSNFKICKKCKMEYMLGNYFRKIPIKNGFIWHFYLFEEKLPNNIKCRLEQLLKPFYLIIDYFKKTCFILDDFFNDDMFKIIDNLKFNDIITITYDC